MFPYANFKCIPFNLPNDLYKIYTDLSDVFGSQAFTPFEMNENAKCARNIKPTSIEPCKNRFYVVSQLNHIVLSVFGVDDEVIENLDHIYGDEYDAGQPEAMMNNYLCSLYTFSGNRMGRYNISPYNMIELAEVFRKENIVDYRQTRRKFYSNN